MSRLFGLKNIAAPVAIVSVTAGTLAAIAIAAFAQFAGDLPITSKTPGVVLDTDESIVCAPTYVAGRGNATTIAEQKAYFRYAVPYPSANHVADHLIPVELGGSHDTMNLWPQHKNPAFSYNVKLKNDLEAALRKEVCVTHVTTLAAAQEEIKTDWIEAYKKRFALRPH